MPKSNFLRKKSKVGATADFKRLKAKVGKRAPQAASHTDTSFKSKRVRVSAQSILHDLGDADAITARGQGVQELLVQLRHYSPASKREALSGLKTIVDRHRGFAEVNFARLAESSLELAVCFDNDVRKALLAFQESLLGCVSDRTFSPFANIYVAYVVSAMTSFDGGVRRDSLHLLAFLLARFPSAVADRAERLAPNYPTLLAVDPASKKQTGRTEALKSLVGLFRAVSLRYGRARADVGSSGVSSGSSGSVGLSWKGGSRKNSALMLCKCATPALSSGNKSASDSGVAEADAPVKALASILPQMLEKLREVWMESLAAIPPNIGVMQSVVDLLLEAVASPAWIANSLGNGNIPGTREDTSATSWQAKARSGDRGRKTGPALRSHGEGAGDRGGRGAASAYLQRFVPLVLEVFPVRPQEGELLGDVEAERLRAIQALNMGLCELVVAACTGPAAATAATTTGAEGAKRTSEGEDSSDWLSPVLAHVHEVLRDGVGRSGAAGPQIPSVLRVLTAAAYNSTGESKGSASWADQRQRLLSAFGDFFESLPPRSEAKLLCSRFVCSLATTLLVESASRGGGGVGSDNDHEAAREICRWLQPLPDLLCRWDGEYPDNSVAALRTLVEVAKHASAAPPSSTATGTLSSFSGSGQAKGKAALITVAAAPGVEQGGAWATVSSELVRSIEPKLLREFFSGRGFLVLPPSAQLDAISLVYHLPSVPVCVVSALAAVCSDPAALSGNVRSFALEVMYHRRRSFSPSAYIGFLASVLTGLASVKQLGGIKRTGSRAGEVRKVESDKGGKRRRRKSTINREKSQHNQAKTAVVEAEKVAPLSPPSLWGAVFERDEVTGNVCNSLAMIGSRSGVLLEALQPTLLQLLGQGNGRGGEVNRGKKKPAVVQSLDEDPVAAELRGQRAAMACVLCCWEGLNIKASTTPAAAADSESKSPLCALEKPMAAACVAAMKTAGTAEAAQQARGVRLLRPVIVLVKRWPALLPLILTLIVELASDVASAAVGSEETVRNGPVGVRSLEPLLRCLQAVVRDPGLQGQLRRRHVGALRVATRTICGALHGSPLKDLVVQLRADVDLLGGVCAEGSR